MSYQFKTTHFHITNDPRRTGRNEEVLIRLSGILLSLMLCACVSLPRTSPTQPRVHVVPGDGGFYFTQEDRDYEVSRGIDPSYFTSTPKGFFVTKLNEEKMADFLDAERNPEPVTK